MAFFGFAKNTFLEVSPSNPGKADHRRSLSDQQSIDPSLMYIVQEDIRVPPEEYAEDPDVNPGCRVSVASLVTGNQFSIGSKGEYSCEPSTSRVSSSGPSMCGEQISISNIARENAVPEECRVTVMIRNIPCRYAQEDLYKEMAAYGILFNFMYLPPARHSPGNLGYAFANFLCPQDARKFIDLFTGHVFRCQPNSKKRAAPCFAELQGFLENVEFYSQLKVSKSRHRPFVDFEMSPSSSQPPLQIPNTG